MCALSQTLEITNKRGLHARASAKFVTYVSRLPHGVDIVVEKNGVRVTGTSIMGLMMLGAAMGDSITIHARARRAASAKTATMDDGVTADTQDIVKTALQQMVALVEDNFGEE